jgi:exodeoxyribonuclease-1
MMAAPKPSLYWHDYETFGLNPRYDRPSQFAGLRTDLDLNVIGEPLLEYCQPTDDYLPQPEACVLTGITPQHALDRGVPEPEFIRRILDELGKPGTCGLGYNSLRFDDEVTRHTLWRNFFDPYAREWRDGCSRWDIIDMVRLTYALRPEGIEWPMRDNGKPAFKLELLTAANGLEHSQAHDALSDVHATIALAKMIRSKQPRLYDFVFSNRGKVAAQQLLAPNSHEPVLHVSEKYPTEYGCLSLVMPIAPHPTNKNQVLVYDLRHDPAELLALDAEEIHERIYTPRADLPDGVERIALKAVHLNKCPILAPLKTLLPAQAARLQLDLEQCKRHHAVIFAEIAAVAAKVQAVFQIGEFESGSDPEQDLYGGFVSDDDRRLCDAITRLSGAELASHEPRFRDPRLHELLFRYRGRHYPETLNEIERDEWQNWRNKRLEYAPDGGLSLQDYHDLIAQLRTQYQNQPDKLQTLTELSAWGQRLVSRAT